MTVVYSSCHSVIGSFNDTEYIVHMLNRVWLIFCLISIPILFYIQCEDKAERDRLLQFMNAVGRCLSLSTTVYSLFIISFS